MASIVEFVEIVRDERQGWREKGREQGMSGTGGVALDSEAY